MMKPHQSALRTAAGSFLLTAALPLHAEPIAIESFNDAPSAFPAGLEGKNTGNGWGGAWKEFGSNASNGIFVNSVAVTSDIAATASGNHARVNGSTTGAGIGRNLTITVGTDGTTAWISYRTQNNDTEASEAFAVVSMTLAEARRVLVGATRSVGNQSYTDGQFDLAYEPTGTNANVAPRNTANHFVVLRFDFGAGNSDTVTVFWDPTSTTDFNGAGSARLSGINATFDGIAFTAGSATLNLGEIRIGTTLADVLGDGGDPPAPIDSDTDSDGLLDDWETTYGLDQNDNGSINASNGPDGDPDGDGLPNRDEQLLGSSPINAADPDSRTWNPRPAKTHLLAISAHPDDEGIFFGGLLPYTVQVRRLNAVMVTVVSDRVTKDQKTREAEMRNAVWKYGMRHQPVFGRFLDHADLSGGINSLNNAWNAWDGDLSNGVADLNANSIPDGREAGARYIAEQIRRYRPQVVAAHDISGEYGHGAHQATALCTIDAFAMAADPALAIAGLPPWQVKKLYIHKYGSNRLFHDFWTIANINDGGVMKSPLQVANEALDFHISQGKPNVSTVYAAGEVASTWEPHPSEWWGLYATTVGPDSVKPDFTAPDANNVPMSYSGWARGDLFEHLTIFPDKDCDDLPDDWELARFASLGAANPLADDDGDGRNNRDEFIAGLNPKLSDRNNLSISAIGSTVNFSVPAATGSGYEGLIRRYRLRYSPDLLNWNTVIAEGVAAGTPLTHSVSDAGARGFYRIEMTVE